MKFSGVFREASRDVSTGTARSVSGTLIYSLLVAILVFHELLTVTGIIDRAADYQAAGGNTHIIVASGRIDGEACDALSVQHNVASAAMRLAPEKLRAHVMRSAPLEQYVATPGITELLNAQAVDGTAVHRAGALVSDQVTEQFGRLNAPLSTDAGDVTFAGIFAFPDDGRRIGLGFASIYPELPEQEPYDECWVQSWPENPETISLLTSVVLPATEVGAPQPEVTQWNTTLGAGFDGQQMFADRMSRFNPYFAIFFGSVIGFMLVRRRRLEIAAARHAGVGLSALLGIQLLQQFVWIFAGGALVFCAGAIMSLGYPESSQALITLTLRIIGMASIGALASVSFAVCAVRESSLFSYFQNRS